jgi:hypothetical protein
MHHRKDGNADQRPRASQTTNKHNINSADRVWLGGLAVLSEKTVATLVDRLVFEPRRSAAEAP